MKVDEAIKENRWLILVAALLLAIALYITLTPEVQALRPGSGQAQRGECRQATSYACVLRSGQRVCGYLTYTVCVPSAPRTRERRGFW
jgi:hypothetical protein